MVPSWNLTKVKSPWLRATIAAAAIVVFWPVLHALALCCAIAEGWGEARWSWRKHRGEMKSLFRTARPLFSFTKESTP